MIASLRDSRFNLFIAFLFLSNFFHHMNVAREVHSVEDVIALFPSTIHGIKSLSEEIQKDFERRVDAIRNLSDDDCVFENVALAYDRAESDLFIILSALYVLQETSPIEDIRNVAHSAVVEIEKSLIDHGYHNRELYEKFKKCHDLIQKTDLDEEQKYYVEKMLIDFRRRGMNLPKEEGEIVEKLNKELTLLTLDFERNITNDLNNVMVEEQSLKGLREDFVNALKKDENGFVVLGVDYPTYFTVLGHCENRDTREKMWRAFHNRAYPKNSLILEQIVEKRDRLAKIMGCESFAHFEIAEGMAETPERVQDFLSKLTVLSQKKALREFENMMMYLPESVELTEEGKIQPWDVRFLQEAYKKRHLNIDETEIAEYFPLDNTIEQLLEIYGSFFNITFEEIKIENRSLWHEDVRLLKVNDEQSKTIGFILLDLFPRPNKYSHAAQIDIVPALQKDSRTVGLSIVLANFPKATDQFPSLLKRDDVNTFFHEFGHALHSLFGATKMALFAGTHVKTDFVEMPSQMFEEWMWEKQILKKISKHYKTGEPLSDDLIEKILRTKYLEAGSAMLQQCTLAQFSMSIYFGLTSISRLYRDTLEAFEPHIVFNEADHFYLSFEHLMGYASRYYSYLWSKVFALDLFCHIKKRGLLSQGAGEQFKSEILSKGGSIHPTVLLKNFLGREPEIIAFMADLGFTD